MFLNLISKCAELLQGRNSSPSRRRGMRTSNSSVPAQVQLLEPRTLLSSTSEFLDPHPELGNRFGGTLVVLKNGNVVITSVNDSAGGSGAGAVYEFDGVSGKLISKITGSNPDDHIGSGGVIALTNGNFVIISPGWNGSRGAVTFGNGAIGVSGTVSDANSLLGSSVGDQLGSGDVTPLPNGNYVIDSPAWANGPAKSAGAVTLGDGALGIFGTVNVENSLTGTRADDKVGSGGITVLKNGNFVVKSDVWNNDTAPAAGAVTFGDASAGLPLTISEQNSLIGASSNDRVGSGGITPLPNGNYVVSSPLWNNGTALNAGAVTFGSGTAGVSGIISAANSLTGSTANDKVGSDGVTVLSNGNYIVKSPSWSKVTSPAPVVNAIGGNHVLAAAAAPVVAQAAGAVTFGTAAAGVSGVVSSANSLVGNSANDKVGSGGITPLKNGNFLISSPEWNNGTALQAGAVTFVNGTNGLTGSISAANSLVGTSTNDRVGSSVLSYPNVGIVPGTRPGITVLTNGNYVVCSSNWTNGTISNAGAVTWGSGTTGVVGAVSASNSLVGLTANDEVGIGGVTALTNGNYVVSSFAWNYPLAVNGTSFCGAATFGNGVSGVKGAVSKLNSLIGTQRGDSVGGRIIPLTNGNYVVNSPSWTNDWRRASGAVTFGNGTTGISGLISAANSLVSDSSGTRVGSGAAGANTPDVVYGDEDITGVIPLPNGNYVVVSPLWINVDTSANNAGAVTFGDGTSGVTGRISQANSLVGTRNNDFVGSSGVLVLSNGNYVVTSPRWNLGTITNAGASTFCSGTFGNRGAIDPSNSLVGGTAGLGLGFIYGTNELTDGNYLVRTRTGSFPSATTFAITGTGKSGVQGVFQAINSVNVTGSSTLSGLVIDKAHSTFYTTFPGSDTNVGKVYRGVPAVGFFLNPPTLTNLGVLSYTPGQPATPISPNIVVDKLGTGTTIASVEITITNYLASDDRLRFTNNDSALYGNIQAGFDNLTGKLTLVSADYAATTAQWSAALKAVAYVNINPNVTNYATRLVKYVASNGLVSSDPVFGKISLGSKPVLSNTSTINAGANQRPKAINPGITLADVNHPKPVSATVTISNYVASDDRLAFVNNDSSLFGNIQATFDTSTGKLQLTSAGNTATLTEWQYALSVVTYVNINPSPNFSPRTVQFQFSNGDLSSNVIESTINLFSAPSLDKSNVLSYGKSQTPLVIDPLITVNYSATLLLKSAVIKVTNYVANDDRLWINYVNPLTGLKFYAGFNNKTGELKLTTNGAGATMDQWQAVLRTVTYRNINPTPNVAFRNVTFQISDGVFLSNSLLCQVAIGSVPSLANTSTVAVPLGPLNRTQRFVVNPNITLSNPDHPGLFFAKVEFTKNYESNQDRLEFVNNDPVKFGGVQGTFDVKFGNLALFAAVNTTTLAQWQNALRAVTYFNDYPLINYFAGGSPSTAHRGVTFSAVDALFQASNEITSQIGIGLPPKVTGSGAVAYYPKGASTGLPIVPGIDLTYYDSDQVITATVKLTNYLAKDDVLEFIHPVSTRVFDAFGDIQGSFDTTRGVLILTGSLEPKNSNVLEKWVNALRAVTYRNKNGANGNFATRNVEIQLSDGLLQSNVFRSQITFANAPILANASTLNYQLQQPATLINPGITVTDVYHPTLASATVSVTNYWGYDQLAFKNNDSTKFGNIQGGFDYITGVLTLTSAGSSATVTQWQTALRAVTFTSSATSKLNLNMAPRKIAFQISDGTVKSNIVTSTVTMVN